MLRLTNTNIYLICIILALVLVMGYLYMSRKEDHSQEGYEPKKRQPEHRQTHQEGQPDLTAPPAPQQGGAGGPLPQHMENKPCLALLHADWCPHCKHLLPEWENVKKAVGGRHILADIESKNPLMASFTDLKGFPTIRYFPQGLNNPGVYVEYTGDRTANTILQFLSENSQKGN